MESQEKPKERLRLTVPIAVLDFPAHVLRGIDPEHVKRLAADIKVNGLRHSIPVMKLPDGKLIVLGGAHRIAAKKLLGHSEIEVDVHDGELDEDEAERQAYLDNELRRDMSLFQCGVFYRRRKEKLGLSQIELSVDLGVERSKVCRALKLVENAVPALIELIRKGQIQDHAAASIARLSPEQQMQAIRRAEAIAGGRDRQDGEKLIKSDSMKRIVAEILAEAKPKAGRKSKFVEAAVDGMRVFLEIAAIDDMFQKAKLLPKAILWLKKNGLEPSPANLAEALARVAAKKSPKAA